MKSENKLDQKIEAALDDKSGPVILLDFFALFTAVVGVLAGFVGLILVAILAAGVGIYRAAWMIA